MKLHRVIFKKLHFVLNYAKLLRILVYLYWGKGKFRAEPSSVLLECVWQDMPRTCQILLNL